MIRSYTYVYQVHYYNGFKALFDPGVTPEVGGATAPSLGKIDDSSGKIGKFAKKNAYF